MPGPGNLPAERSEQPEEWGEVPRTCLDGLAAPDGIRIFPCPGWEYGKTRARRPSPRVPRPFGLLDARRAAKAENRVEEHSLTKAIWNGAVIAESAACEIVDGNRYFPPDSVRRDHLRPSEKHTVCHWKGVASYFDVVVGGQVNKDAAWYYPETKEAAQNIRGYIAFWRGVRVED